MALPIDEEMIPFDSLIKVGFPTFDEFRKNPDKYRKGADELFASADASTQNPGMRRKLDSQKYMWRNQYVCSSLEQIERIAKEEGFQANDLEMLPITRKLHGTDEQGDIEIIIQYWPKGEFQAMGRVSTNND